MTNLITRRALFSPLFLQSCYLFHESGLDNPFIRNFPRWRQAIILDYLIEPEIAPFDTPIPKSPP